MSLKKKNSNQDKPGSAKVDFQGREEKGNLLNFCCCL